MQSIAVPLSPAQDIDALPLPLRRRWWRRQILIGILFIFLAGVIYIYWQLTDSVHVREMAENYLTDAIGGHVHIEKATLSIFEGLRLENISIYSDEDDPKGSEVFHARAFHVKTSPRALLNGDIEPVQIMAVAPVLQLVENSAHDWNFTKFARRERPERPEKKKRSKPIVLPEVLLRGGVLHVTNAQNVVRSLAVDGVLTPIHEQDGKVNKYLFNVESRGATDIYGPRLRGVLDLKNKSISCDTGPLNTKSPGDEPTTRPFLQDLTFDRTLQNMLPAEVRDWWQRHHLTGRLTIPILSYKLASTEAPEEFRIAVDLNWVRLSVPADELQGRAEFEWLRLYRPIYQMEGLPNLALLGRARYTQYFFQPPPLDLKDVRGRIVFTPGNIRFETFSGRIENNVIVVKGDAGSARYAPTKIDITAKNIFLPRQPDFLVSLPHDVQKLFAELMPSGRGDATVQLSKNEAGKLETSGQLTILDGAFQFHEFPYPLRKATGVIRFGRDRATQRERVDLENLRGLGMAGTKNENGEVFVDGWISPLDRNSAVHINVRAPHVHMDEHVRAALPPEAREAVTMFDRKLPDGAIEPVQMTGAFKASAVRPYGPKKKVIVNVDLDIEDASGAFAGFPYPMEKARSHVHIGPDHVLIKDFHAERGPGVIDLSGRVTFGANRPVRPDLRLSVRNAPINEDLTGALSKTYRSWFEKLALKGRLDVEGRIFPADFWNVAPADNADIDWDLRMKVHEGAAWLVGNTYALHDAEADIHLNRSELILRDVRGKRGASPVTGTGRLAWPNDDLEYSLDFAATNLLLDKTFYGLVPEGARSSWDELRPQGQIDLSVSMKGGPKEGDIRDAYSVSIIPKGLTVTPVSLPYRIDKLGGEIVCTPGLVMLNNITGAHGEATIALAGKGVEKEGHLQWEVGVKGSELPLDADFKKGMPQGLVSFVKSLEADGLLSVDCPRFVWTTTDLQTMDPKTGKPLTASQMDFEQTRFTLASGKMDVGVSLSQMAAVAELTGSIREGDLYAISGKIDASTMKLAGRTLTNFHSNIVKPAGKPVYQFANLQGRFCDGLLAGQVDLESPANGASRYALQAAMRDIDVHELSGNDEKVAGRMSASISMSGDWSNPHSRQGRGDIRVQGNELYKVPVVMGWLQVTNLSLPTKSPFNDATAEYFVDGNKLTFGRIELRAKNMLMSGSGTLDFSSKRVNLAFTTDNPNMPNIPLIGPLIRGGKNELFQIKVRGTIQEPKVHASSMNTFSTTIDEVFNANEKEGSGSKSSGKR